MLIVTELAAVAQHAVTVDDNRCCRHANSEDVRRGRVCVEGDWQCESLFFRELGDTCRGPTRTCIECDDTSLALVLKKYS